MSHWDFVACILGVYVHHEASLPEFCVCWLAGLFWLVAGYVLRVYNAEIQKLHYANYVMWSAAYGHIILWEPKTGIELLCFGDANSTRRSRRTAKEKRLEMMDGRTDGWLAGRTGWLTACMPGAVDCAPPCPLPLDMATVFVYSVVVIVVTAVWFGGGDSSGGGGCSGGSSDGNIGRVLLVWLGLLQTQKMSCLLFGCEYHHCHN